MKKPNEGDVVDVVYFYTSDLLSGENIHFYTGKFRVKGFLPGSGEPEFVPLTVNDVNPGRVTVLLLNGVAFKGQWE